jgi:DNA invertase Pin-like site-specific DNA recombinase
MQAAIYARVSTLDQEPENQFAELRRYASARGWKATEYVDAGVSGAKDRRPALDLLLRDARRRRFDVLVVWRLDRLGRSLKHLVLLLEELQALGIAFVSLAEGIDATTPAGKLQRHILAAIAEFERARIAERVRAGLARVRASGRRLGRPMTDLDTAQIERTAHLSIRDAATALGISRSVLHRARLARKTHALHQTTTLIGPVGPKTRPLNH